MDRRVEVLDGEPGRLLRLRLRPGAGAWLLLLAGVVVGAAFPAKVAFGRPGQLIEGTWILLAAPLLLAGLAVLSLHGRAGVLRWSAGEGVRARGWFRSLEVPPWRIRAAEVRLDDEEGRVRLWLHHVDAAGAPRRSLLVDAAAGSSARARRLARFLEESCSPFIREGVQS